MRLNIIFIYILCLKNYYGLYYKNVLSLITQKLYVCINCASGSHLLNQNLYAHCTTFILIQLLNMLCI